MRRRLIVIIAICLLFTSLLLAFWRLSLEPAFLWHRSLAQVNMLQIAVMRYNETHTNPPASIEVLVEAKKLPKVSSIYASSLKHQKQIPHPIPYFESDYEIFVDGTDTVIRLKPAVSNEVKQIRRLRELNLNSISARVDPDSRVLYAPDPMKEERR
jgi:hypothetical protein